MPNNIGGPGGGDGVPGPRRKGPTDPAREQALEQLKAQREELAQARLPQDLKRVRDAFLEGLERPASLNLEGLQLPALRPRKRKPKGEPKEPMPIDVRPKYGAPVPPIDVTPGPIAPMYGLAPTPQEPMPIDIRPKYGAPMPPVDVEPGPFAPMYGLAPTPREPMPIDIRPKYGAPMPPVDVEPGPFAPMYGLAPIPQVDVEPGPIAPMYGLAPTPQELDLDPWRKEYGWIILAGYLERLRREQQENGGA
jgi:hypothetical protein